MEPSKINPNTNPVSRHQDDLLKSTAALPTDAAVASAFNCYCKTVPAGGTRSRTSNRMTDSLSDRPLHSPLQKSSQRPLQSHAVHTKGARTKLYLKRPKPPDISISQIEVALKKTMNIRPSKGSDQINGAQGTVDKWMDKDGNCLAVKIIQPKVSNMCWTGLEKGEINSILVPEHPNIINARKLLLVNTDKKCFIIQSSQDIPGHSNKNLSIIAAIYDWIDGKDLFEQLAAGKHKDLINLAVQVSLDMCKALGHLHKNGIVYRDLKTENIMFDGQYRLIDFGHSKYIGEDTTQTPNSGTAAYISPESCRTHDKKIDIWNLGVLMLDIAGRWTPADYPKKAMNQQVIQNIQAFNFSMLSDEQREDYLRDQLSDRFSTCPELLDLACSILKKADSRPCLKDIETTLSKIDAQLMGKNLDKKTGKDSWQKLHNYESSVNLKQKPVLPDIDSLSICEENTTQADCANKQVNLPCINPSASTLKETGL